MKIKMFKVAAVTLGSVLALGSGQALAQDAKDLDQLLDFVKRGQVTEAKENRAREQRFARDKANQAQELKNAEAERARQEALSAQLEDTFEQNELLVAAKQAQLKEKLGSLDELFGHLTSAAGDLSSNIGVSLVSAQYPGREVFLQELITKMSGSDTLPSIEEIERVWYEL
ncbi:MAG: energy transducer TonB, partial [Halioglobus sp.]